ncbi:hypothetical protein [Acidilobus sp. 7A]|uniref:hypothetical protein n=1 Tax=Acidilobus sp. 7A TaxID=1577685 RepID=UPI000764EF59|nr:hypothetical protein [Acidilobus sp. 7A]AMD30729.1 hypothetical protein SE86_04765 [Acidilobus sp. 7A]
MGVEGLRPGDRCPRCGRPIDWVGQRVIRGHVYYYAVHEIEENGRKRTKQCYLGAKEYTYVVGQHADLGLQLKGLISELEGARAANYIVEIARAIEEQMGGGSLPSRKAYALAEAISKLCALYPKLREYAERKAREEGPGQG